MPNFVTRSSAKMTSTLNAHRKSARLAAIALCVASMAGLSGCTSMESNGSYGPERPQAKVNAEAPQARGGFENTFDNDNEAGFYFQDVETLNEKEMGLKISRKGSITVRTYNERNYANELRRLHEKFGGLVMGFSSGSVSYKLPFNRLEELITYLENHENIDVDSFDFSAFDQTGTYYSADARLATKRAFKARLEELAKQATGVDELLKFEREIMRLQDEIDQFESQKRSIELTAGLVDVTLYIR